MTEGEWLTCTDPDAMLAFFRGWRSRARWGRPSARKLRLFSCACCRRIWDDLTDPSASRAVEVAEAYADRLATGRRLEQAREEVWAVLATLERYALATPERFARHAVVCAASPPSWPKDAARYARITRSGAHRLAEGAAQCAYLRCLFGNPFRPVALGAAWVSADVSALARAAYDERLLPRGALEPARLALLADALEDAGCDSADLLSHLRGPGPHVRGCWVVDLLLGRP